MGHEDIDLVVGDGGPVADHCGDEVASGLFARFGERRDAAQVVTRGAGTLEDRCAVGLDGSGP
jgi:hypothetical protein